MTSVSRPASRRRVLIAILVIAPWLVAIAWQSFQSSEQSSQPEQILEDVVPSGHSNNLTGQYLALKHAQTIGDFVTVAHFAEMLFETEQNTHAQRLEFSFKAFQNYLLLGDFDKAEHWFVILQNLQEQNSSDFKRDFDGLSRSAQRTLVTYRAISRWNEPIDREDEGTNKVTNGHEDLLIDQEIIRFWKAAKTEPHLSKLIETYRRKWQSSFGDGDLVQGLLSILTLLAGHYQDQKLEIDGTPKFQEISQRDESVKKLIGFLPNLSFPLALILFDQAEGEDRRTIRQELASIGHLVEVEDYWQDHAPVTLMPGEMAGLMLLYLGSSQLNYNARGALLWSRYSSLLLGQDSAPFYLAGGALLSMYEINGVENLASLAHRTLSVINPPYRHVADILQARVYAEQEQIPKSLELLAKAQDSHLLRPFAYFEEGLVHAQADEHPAAIAAYSEALTYFKDKDEIKSDILYRRAAAFDRNDQWQQAAQDLQASLRLDPEQAHVLNYLAYGWVIRQENLERALELLEKAETLSPNRGYITDSVGWALYQQGRFLEAIEKLELAVELSPGIAEIVDHLGDAYWRVGRTREAEYQWRRALVYVKEDDMVDVAAIQIKLKQGLD